MSTITQFPSGNTRYRIEFDYLARTFVVVTLVNSSNPALNRVLEVGRDYRFLNPTMIEMLVDQSGFDIVRIHRQTGTDLVVDFRNGSVLTASDLTNSELQAIHIAEEGRDQTVDLAKEYADAAGISAGNAKDSEDEARRIAESIKAAGLLGYITRRSFENGFNVTIWNEVLLWEEDGAYYRWDGTLPKNVPAGSTPETSGGVGLGAWVSVGDAALRSDLAKPSGAGLVGGLPVFVTSEMYAGGASTTSTNNDAAITAAIADAAATGNTVYWPSVYEVQGNIPNFHSVHHDGPGGIKRGGETYRVHPMEWTSNTLYVTAGSPVGNDGLSAAYPMSGMPKVSDALKAAGPVLNGTWNISVGAGVMTEPAIFTAIQSTNPINITGPVVSGQPTAEIDVTGQNAVYALWFGNGMRFKLSHMLLRGARNGSGLASGIVLDAGTTGHLLNVWTRDCEQNGVNANIRCRLLVEGGDYQADATAIRMYGNTTGFVGWNNVRVKVRDASRGVHTSGSSYSHVDNTDFINTAYGNVSEMESHATNYNNTFDGVSVGWETRSHSTLNTNNPTFITPPRLTKGRALLGMLGSNTDFNEPNRDTRNIQFYPYLGATGRTSFGYSDITTPFKTYQFSGDGLPSLADWSIAAGVNFVFDWGTPAASNYIGIGAGSTGFSGVAFGDETNPSRGLLRHQAGSLFMSLGGTSKYRFTPTTFGPMIDNDLTCGASAFRIKEYFGVTGAINTSDAREKTAPAIIDDAVLDAWGDVQLIAFQWLEAIMAKGEDSARWHFGVIAQQVRDAFIAHGLDGTRYGLLCYDEWEDKFEPVVLVRENPQTGDLEEYHTGEMTLVLAAGNRWGIRPDQCLFLEAAYHRRRCDRIEARLEKLEGN